jgi:hypothetical protein
VSIPAALRHFVLVAGVLAVAGYAAIYTLTDKVPIRSDGYSYYVYLPSWFLYHDVTLEGPARECCGGSYPSFTGITRSPGTGRWVDPHPIGVAILMAPFFVGAHLLTLVSNLPRDGFSFYYQHAAGLAGLTYFLAGLVLLRRILVRHFSPAIALATLVAITWGTNLFHYGTYDSAFSHAFSFCVICLLIDLTERWWATESLGSTVGLGLTAALIFLTRHTNVIFLLLVPLYGVTSSTSARQRPAALWARRRSLAITATIAAIGVAPQLALYKAATGAWLINPYATLGVGFEFGSPHLFEVLFSPEKGLFFWSPVLVTAVLGWMLADGWAMSLVAAGGVIFFVDTYLIASWWDWQFGGSFGHRGFTDGLGLAAIFTAAFFRWAERRPRLAIGVATLTSLAVLLSVAQMLQYWKGILPIANTTWDQYRQLFLRFH